MTKLPSIQRRLLCTLAAVGLVWGLATTLAVGFVVRHEVDEVLDHGLKEAAEIILSVLQYNAALLSSGEGQALPVPAHDEQLVWQVLDASGQVELRSYRSPAQALSTQRAEGFVRRDGWRVYVMPFAASGRTLLVAQSGAERQEARLEAVISAVLAALVVGAGAVFLLRRRLRLELAPIAELAQAVRGHDPVARGSTLPGPTREEMLPIHAAIADLGGRLAKRVANEQAFSAHAAHALRTPLATVIANLAVAQRRATTEDDRQFLQRCRDATSRLRRVVTALLTMFRTGNEPRLQPVDVNALVAQIPFESLSVSCEARVPVHADPDLLSAALMNLLDNAQRHGASSAHVRAFAYGEAHMCLRVSDDGPGIPTHERRSLQDELDEERYGGRVRLGLMLVDLVARAHGGRCSLLPASAGFAVTVTFKLPTPRQ